MKKIIFLLLIAVIYNCSYEAPIIEWEDGYIPYYYSGNFSSNDIEIIEQGMRSWESVCGVKFEETLPRSNAYEIIRTDYGNEWASSIGENNVQNYMFYSSGYGAYGHVLHELGHCLGLIHEHQRPDRDNYISVIWDKILPEYEYNFDIRDNPLINEEEFPYDYDSIMHYNSKGFSIDGSDTIVVKDPIYEIGQREYLSEQDIAKCVAIYGEKYQGGSK